MSASNCSPPARRLTVTRSRWRPTCGSPDISTLDLGRAVNVAAGISGVIAGDPYGRVPTVLLAAALDLLGPELGPPD